MKPPKNPNYAAQIVVVRNIKQLDNCDNVVALPILGLQAIVGKDTEEGTLGVLFGPETKLSPEMASRNNLYRHSELNADQTKVGYLEDHGRVKALKFRGHRSDALFLPLSSLAWASPTAALVEGDLFDELDGHPICEKYVPANAKNTSPCRGNKQRNKVDDLFFPEHFDTENWWRNEHKIPGTALVSVTQKLHGTSLRVSNALVARDLSWIERLAKRLRIPVVEHEYRHVVGSRRVIKGTGATGFYGDTDLWQLAGERFRGILPKSCMVYAEIIGWTPDGAAIQKGYTYRIPQGKFEVYVYRITTINPDGQQVDWSWEGVKQFCEKNALNHVPDLGWWTKDALEEAGVDDFLDRRLNETGYIKALPLEPGKPVDEGVCIRTDGINAYVLKAKSPLFLQYETKQLDTGTADLESVA